MRRLFGFAFLCLLASVLNHQMQAQSSGSANMKMQTVIAKRTNKIGVTAVVAVDRDDAVHEIEIDLPDTKGPVIWANLGARVFQSGRIVLAEVLPADKVATAARRVTLASGDVMHAVIAWGLSEVQEYLG